MFFVLQQTFSRKYHPFWALGLAMFGLTLALLTLRPAATYHMPIEDNLDVQAEGLTPTEFGDGRLFRWLEPYSYLRLPGMAQADHTLLLLVHESNPTSRAFDATLDGVPVLHTQLRPGWQIVRALLPASVIQPNSPRELAFRIAPLDRKPELGLAIATLTIEQVRPGVPQLGTLLAFSLCAALLVFIALVVGLPAAESLLIVGALLIGLTACLLSQAMPTAVLLRTAVACFTLSAAVVVSARLLAWRVWPTHHAWLARTVILVVGLFLAHAVGMQALRFVEIDHMARANHMLNMAKGGTAAVQARLSNQYEWGIATVPYSLLSYQLLMPLTYFFGESRPLTTALKVAVSLLDATTPLLLYALVRIGGGTARTAWFAALLFAALPVTHLYFHDGSYPTIIGLWVAVAALVTLALFVRSSENRGQESGGRGQESAPNSPTLQRRDQGARNQTIARRFSAGGSGQVFWALASIAMLTLGALIYVTQAAFLPIVVGTAGLTLALFRRDRIGWWIIGIVLTSVLLAIVLYYGSYIEPVLQAILPQLQAGAHLGVDSGRLPGPLVGPFWLQVWGHLRVFPLALMLLGIIVLLRQGDRLIASIGIGYVTLLTCMSVVDLRFSMWNKHWYFALPGIALLAAFGCDWLASRGRVTRYAMFATLTLLLAASAVAWANRVFLYEWSLWSL